MKRFHSIQFTSLTILAFSVSDAVGERALNQAESSLLAKVQDAAHDNSIRLDSFYASFNFDSRHVPSDGSEGHLVTARAGEVAKEGSTYATRDVLWDGTTLHYADVSGIRRVKTTLGDHEFGNILISQKEHQAARPSTPPPWELIDGGFAASGASTHPGFGDVRSVTSEGSRSDADIVVRFVSTQRDPSGSQVTLFADISYAAAYNYLPTGYVVYDKDKPSLILASARADEIMNVGTEEEPVYLASEISMSRSGTQNTTESSFKVLPESISLGPVASRDIFRITRLPGDSVVDLDLGIELRGPAHLLQPLELGEVSMQEPTSDVHSIDRADSSSRHLILTLPSGRSLTFILIHAGEYVIGAPVKEIGYPVELLRRLRERKPGVALYHPASDVRRRVVELQEDTWVATHELTVDAVKEFIPEFPTHVHDGLKWNADNVPSVLSIDAALLICERVSAYAAVTVEVPREDVWEVACRAGSSARFPWGEEAKETAVYANVADATYRDELQLETQEDVGSDGAVYPTSVGSFKPNKWGFYDMIGNLPEWCVADEAGSVDDNSQSRLLINGSSYALRGGGWASDLTEARPSARTELVSADQKIATLRLSIPATQISPIGLSQHIEVVNAKVLNFPQHDESLGGKLPMEDTWSSLKWLVGMGLLISAFGVFLLLRGSILRRRQRKDQ